jgi:hypothetical protein
MMVRKLGVLVAGTALMTVTACGGGGGGRPSADEVSKSLKDGKASSFLGSASQVLDQKAYDCIGKAIVDSKLSDAAVRALVKGDTKYKGTSQDQKALAGMQSDMQKCAAAAVTK